MNVTLIVMETRHVLCAVHAMFSMAQVLVKVSANLISGCISLLLHRLVVLPI